jgi:hypothetical protein
MWTMNALVAAPPAPPNGELELKVPAKEVDLTKRVRVLLGGEQVQWMTLRTLRAEVLAGHADDWNVVETIKTGLGLLICPFCATGVEHGDEHHVWNPTCQHCAAGVKHPGGTVH